MTDVSKPLKADLSLLKKHGSKDSSASTQENSFTVVKRNGSFVPFRKERIFKALEMAFRDTKKIGKTASLPEEVKSSVHEVGSAVVEKLITLASKGACLSVEGIQDLVEVTLMQMDHHDVAKDYIIYRDQHKTIRDDSPRNVKVRRKDGSIVKLNPMKIGSSIEESFRRSKNVEGPSGSSLVESVNFVLQKVVAKAVLLSKSTDAIDVDVIQDEIEQQLMREGYFSAAKDFILQRSSLGEQSEKPLKESAADDSKQRQFTTVLDDGQKSLITESILTQRLKFACRGLEDLVSSEELLEESIRNFYEEMKEREVDQANIMATRSKIEKEPAYSKVAARLLLDVLYRETLEISADSPLLESTHRTYFKSYLKKGVSLGRISQDLLDFDLDKLAQAIQIQRDDQFSYLGLQTLYDRYFIHDNEQRLETPQIFWMRVSMGLALPEKEEKTQRAIEFYNLLSSFAFTSSTPTLFNSGTCHSQLSSCYLSTIMDDLSHIFKTVSDDAQLSKWAGGIGNDWTNVRATGGQIKGTNGKSQGIIPFLKVANDTAVAVNQCFSPDTTIYTDKGVQLIGDVSIGDLVLGIDGKYHKVTNKFVYNQEDPMVSLDLKYSLKPIHVTSGHPIYAIRSKPEYQTPEQVKQALKEGHLGCSWVEAGDLKPGDYIAQTSASEVVPAPGFDLEDLEIYGILLKGAEVTKDGSKWAFSGSKNDCARLSSYLKAQGISHQNKQFQVLWTAEKVEQLDGASGESLASDQVSFAFDYPDLYMSGEKHIAPRFMHLPKPQTFALIRGLLEEDGSTSESLSEMLLEGMRYQMLRLGVPSTGKEISAPASLAKHLGCKVSQESDWVTVGTNIFSKLEKTNSALTCPIVVDLEVEDVESYNVGCLAHNGGKRKGAMCAYLETWHLDIEDFLELRKNTGDERRRTHDMNTANWIPDLFMKRVSENGSWTLFNPSDVPDLHNLYGQAFEKRYQEYEKQVESGEIKLFKKMEALGLWRKMLSMLFETGHPWITFKDPSNIRSPQDHVGVVHSSNLCTEILLNTSDTETAVCNLGSICLPMHVTENGLDEEKLAKTVRTAVRMLDNVIDINFYPIKEASHSNLQHRPIGLGLMGFQDALYIQEISYASHEAVEFADRSMEMISYYAILASSELAKERGAYSSYKGSKWDRGLLPIDTIELLEKERGSSVEMDKSSTMDWSVVRNSIKKYGMRNCNTMAIAPTATISNITGVSQSIEPMYKHLFVKSNLSGEFTIPNTYLVEKLKKLGKWNENILDDLKYFDGSIAEIEEIPDDVKNIFLTAFEIDPEWLIECASRRQKWIDMGQSLNLYLFEPSGKKLHEMYLFAWNKGLKTTYYLRSLAATQIEKSTTDINKRGLQPRWMKNKSASSNVQVNRTETKPLSCGLDPGCESCQ